MSIVPDRSAIKVKGLYVNGGTVLNGRYNTLGTWTSRTSAANNGWRGVTYGNGLFVAVSDTGTGNRVMTSPDGITWTSRTSAADNGWLDVTYGNGLFVAVAGSGTGNRVMTSPDGITWTIRTSAADNNWHGVTYGNGLFVAVATTGTGNRVMTSPDGITWTIRTSAADNNWWGVTYGNGLFVAVAGSGTGNRVMTFSISPLLNTQNSIAIGNNAFVSFNDTTNNTAISSSIAIGYNSVTTGTNSVALGCGAISTANNQIVFGTANETVYIPGQTVFNGNVTIFSPQNQSSMAIGNTSTTGAWGNSIAIGVSSTVNSNVHVGIFQPQVTNVLNSWSDIAFGTPTTGTYANKGLFVAVSYDGSYNRVMNSPDAVYWSTQSTFNFDNSWNGLIFGTTSSAGTYASGTPIFVAVSTTGTNRIMTSADGNTWTGQTASVANAWSCITYGNTSSAGGTYTSGTPIFVAVASSGTNRVMTSQNGSTWTTQTGVTFQHNWQSVTYGAGTFAAVADSSNNCVMTSTNGSTWTNRSTVGFDNSWNSVIYGIPSTGLYADRGVFVAVAYAGTGNRVMASWDGSGAIWNPISVPADSWYSVAYGQGAFMAVSYSGTAMVSTDVLTWSFVSTPALNPWRSITYGTPSSGPYTGKGVFAAVASYGTNRVMTSSFGDSLVTSSIAIGNGAFANGDDSIAIGEGARVSGSTLGTFVQRTGSSNSAWVSITNGIVTATGERVFVAVSTTSGSTSNHIMTSSDGITWTARTAAADNQWTSVTYGIPSSGQYANIGLFVAVSSTGTNRIMTSPDGITWTSRTATLNSWVSVTYGVPSIGIYVGTGIFVAVSRDGTGNRIINSPDGITWTAKNTTGTDNVWTNITYGIPSTGLYEGQGSFVAVADIGTTAPRIIISQDASGWTQKILSGNPVLNWQNVTYGIPSTGIYKGQGLFVSVAYSGTANRVMTSTDLSGWVIQVTPLPDINWYGLTYGNGYFVATAITGTGNRIMSSTDGITWRLQKSPADMSWWGITYGIPTSGIYSGKGLFVAVASGASSAATAVMTANFADVYKTNSMALGNGALTTGSNSLAIGVGSAAIGNNSVAYGVGASVTGNNSVAIGTGAKVDSPFHLGDFKAYTMPIARRIIHALTYGNGLFVAALYSGTTPNKVMTSPDGINWTIRQAVGAIGWHAAAFGIPSTGIYAGQGLFVVLAFDGTQRLMTSPDGINWTVRTTATLDSIVWVHLTYGNGYFVAGSLGTSLAYSSDGITWINFTVAISNYWCVGYGNGVFVAVSTTTGNTANRVYRSTNNGVSWTGYSVIADNAWSYITYGNGIFVAVSSSGTGNRVMTSPDGITWTLRSTPADYSFITIAFGNGLFVVSTNSTNANQFMTSPDGINWTMKSVPYNYAWRFITYGLVNGIGTFVTIVDADNVTPNVMVASFADSNNLNSVAIGQSAYANAANSVAIGNSARVSGQQLSNFVSRASANDAYSYEGITNGVPSSGIYQGQNLFVAVTSTPSTTSAQISIDGINWISVNTPNKGWTNVTYGIPSTGIYAGQGLFVASSSAGTGRIMTSPDGITWTSRVSTASDACDMIFITYGNGIFVAVAPAGVNRSVYSTDGITWSAGSLNGNAGDWYGVTYGNGLFVAVAYQGTASKVAYSSNGNTWTTSSSPNVAMGWLAVTYGIPSTGAFPRGLFVAVAFNGTGNRVMTSTDANTWTSRASSNDTNDWRGITYGNGYFIAVSNVGTNRIMISRDGIYWTGKTSANEAQGSTKISYGVPSSGPYAGQGIFVLPVHSGAAVNRIMTANFIDTYTTNSIAIGNGAVANGNNSTAIGNGAYSFGDNQIVLGTDNQNLMTLSTATNVVAIGTNAGQTSQGGASVAIGISAGNSNQSASSVAIGSSAASTSQGAGSVAIGSSAASTSQGLSSAAIGVNCCLSNTGGFVTAIGSESGKYQTGSVNTFVGHAAGQENSATTITYTGQYNTYIGYGTYASQTNLNNSTAIGVFARITASNQIVLGTATETVSIPGNLKFTSTTVGSYIPTGITYFEQYTHTFTLGHLSNICSLNITRINNLVTITLPATLSYQSTTSSYYSASIGLPTRFRTAVSSYHPVNIQSNSTFQGFVFFNSTGEIRFAYVSPGVGMADITTLVGGSGTFFNIIAMNCNYTTP